ncbi:hypothetical protein CXG81DRAFT_27601 [Caulochytrium protostelioides]|uniref:Uncharacterized protein n=1 Tax=Caulochytrium protostelioides TaxID=1555241 RepID=A0A4P9X3N2_9FUNG|nr:hypothetical protein CXG81DRAFT_27601 [Caulochytrium protostelioides]|eukprot:RKO99645.1 hypothetical protein CXG81DRAFT_27601 [Caulochytrium protostelioides]
MAAATLPGGAPSTTTNEPHRQFDASLTHEQVSEILADINIYISGLAGAQSRVSKQCSLITPTAAVPKSLHGASLVRPMVVNIVYPRIHAYLQEANLAGPLKAHFGDTLNEGAVGHTELRTVGLASYEERAAVVRRIAELRRLDEAQASAAAC